MNKEITIATAVKALESIWSKRVPSAAQVIKELAKMEKQLDAAKTYTDVMAIMQNAKAIKVLFDGIVEVKRAAEWTILVGNRRLGIEVDKVPKATHKGGPKKQITQAGKLVSGRSALEFPSSTRARLLKLSTINKPELRGLAKTLWEAEKDATMRAVLEEYFFIDAKTKRSTREKALAKKIKALPDKRYGVILTDYEWKFKTYSERGKTLTSAENHYPTSELEVLNDRPIEKIAAPDCVWFAWTTVPFLNAQLEIMKNRGFEYKTNCVWDKVNTGTGYWFMNQHEHLLVGTRGKPVAPAMGTQFPSIIVEKAREHSRKPDKSYEIIEAYFSNVPKIELNARSGRDGWDSWGQEAPTAEAAE